MEWSFHPTGDCENKILDSSKNDQQIEYTLSDLWRRLQPHFLIHKEIQCILNATLEEQGEEKKGVLIYASFQYPNKSLFCTNIVAIPVNSNYQISNIYCEDCLNFTMRTVNITGIYTDFVNMFIPNLSCSGYEINLISKENGEKHYIGIMKRGKVAFIYDSGDSDKNPLRTHYAMEYLKEIFHCDQIHFHDCPQQHDNVSCGLYCIFCAICLKENLPINSCAYIPHNLMFVDDLYKTFRSKKMTKQDFLRKYYRGNRIQA